MMLSPFRDERTPSLSIFDNGTSWKDWGTGEGGDVVEFVRLSLGGYREAREWFAERLGTDLCHHGGVKAHSRLAKAPLSPPRRIEWPAELVTGTEATWEAFARQRGYSPSSVSVAVKAGLLRFIRVDGRACFVVTDATRRNGEMRRCDRSMFNGYPGCKPTKAFRLKGVSKAWPVGCDLLRGQPQATSVLLCEGATDLLTAFDLYCKYKRAGGSTSWVPLGILGAGCKQLSLDAADIIRTRRVRIVFDSDKAGNGGAAHWRNMLLPLGCTVQTVNSLPAGRDLTDVAGQIKPEGLFA
ncbi:hypothetical protein OKA04_03695 [Luteolibacter flavescens]|uniref:Toprim domain-containing protein n=1 Tax=Luteolibacter flavescens TaxID=1859460 RepID=A0ABT3FJS7_9BACT|nr:hypothetical protein [Luteolibacter flavescens]MCW1883817.1 hypothetical protein [Luteolibacter flavescens]